MNNHPSSGVFDYHDYAHESDSPQQGAGGAGLAQQQQQMVKVKNGNNSEQNFPVKLHYVLSDLASDGLDHIVSWQPHGRCFIVHKPKQFAEEILPLWFRQTKFSSFQRQLNLYGFKRVTEGPDKGGHYHELFLRGKRFLAHRIPRMKIKGSGPRKGNQPSPDFYGMPYLPPVEDTKTTQQQQQQQQQGGGQDVVHQSAYQLYTAAAASLNGASARNPPSHQQQQGNNNNNHSNTMVLENLLTQQAQLSFANNNNNYNNSCYNFGHPQVVGSPTTAATSTAGAYSPLYQPCLPLSLGAPQQQPQQQALLPPSVQDQELLNAALLQYLRRRRT